MKYPLCVLLLFVMAGSLSADEPWASFRIVDDFGDDTGKRGIFTYDEGNNISQYFRSALRVWPPYGDVSFTLPDYMRLSSWDGPRIEVLWKDPDGNKHVTYFWMSLTNSQPDYVTYHLELVDSDYAGEDDAEFEMKQVLLRASGQVIFKVWWNRTQYTLRFNANGFVRAYQSLIKPDPPSLTTDPFRSTICTWDDKQGKFLPEEVKLWRSYEPRVDVAGTVNHLEKVAVLERDGEGFRIQTQSGEIGWVTARLYIMDVKRSTTCPLHGSNRD